MQRLVQLIIVMSLGATFSGCASSTNNNSPAANANSTGAQRTTPTPSKTDLGQALSNPSSSTEERIKATDAYVADVEAKLPNLTRKERILKPENLKGVTEASLEKIHAYYDGQSLKRIKTYPTGGSQKTEEFYFYNEKLVFVFVEPQGKGKTGADQGAKGERLYFDNNGLVAWYGEDGKPKDTASTAFKTQSGNLVLEAVAFRQLAG